MPEAESILLLHGFSNTGRSWRRLLGSGVRERFSAIAPDLRGHGQATRARPVSLTAVMDDLDVLWASPGTLVGYSQGGRIALHVALSPIIAPRVRRLVLISASPGIADPDERAARRAADEALADAVEAMTIETFAARWAQTPVLAGLPAEIAAEAHADRLASEPAGLAAALRGLGTGALPSQWHRLDRLTMPVTLVAGQRDEKFVALAREMAELIPDARLEIVSGAGHQVHLEAPEVVADLL